MACLLYTSKLIVLGPPGAGKGTQALGVSSRLNVPHISTGNMLRAAVRNETPMGLAAKKFMDAGKLVPDSVPVSYTHLDVYKRQRQDRHPSARNERQGVSKGGT